jgi:hypothetical protein
VHVQDRVAVVALRGAARSGQLTGLARSRRLVWLEL